MSKETEGENLRAPAGSKHGNEGYHTEAVIAVTFPCFLDYELRACGILCR